MLKITDFIFDWSDVKFDKTDGYIFFDDVEKELIPPELNQEDKKRLIEYVEKVKMN